MPKMERMQQAMHAWNRITPKVGDAIISASSAASGTEPTQRFGSLVSITYKFVYINAEDEKAIQFAFTKGVPKNKSGYT